MQFCLPRGVTLLHVCDEQEFQIQYRCSTIAIWPLAVVMTRVGQNNIYTVYMRYFWKGNHHTYGHVRCIYTVLANTTN